MSAHLDNSTGTALRPRPCASRRPPALRQLVRYLVIGAAGTAWTTLSFLLLRHAVGALLANLVALILGTLLSTETVRRVAFGAAPIRRLRVAVQALGVVAYYGAANSVVLIVLHRLDPLTSPAQEALWLTATSVVGGCVRFAVLRRWVFPDVGVPMSDSKNDRYCLK